MKQLRFERNEPNACYYINIYDGDEQIGYIDKIQGYRNMAPCKSCGHQRRHRTPYTAGWSLTMYGRFWFGDQLKSKAHSGGNPSKRFKAKYLAIRGANAIINGTYPEMKKDKRFEA